ncbi:MAG: SDR family NAD(P)-dependent oxidoreductase [bacterium]|nr:SDR family NAD(P)-dependent oxidoreductase [bacterium]
MTKRTALITGATSGIGFIIAKHLARKGYNLLIMARSPEKLKTLTEVLLDIDATISVDGFLCDFSSMESTNAACDAIAKKSPKIDVMLLNAGLWNSSEQKTEYGIEETLQVNLISQIQVFKALETCIPKNETSKVIITASALHQGEIYFNDLEFENGFSGFKAYRQSKLGLMMITRWLSNQTEFEGISFYSVHPGMVSTDLGRDASWFARMIFKLFGKSPEKGAQTHIHVIDTENSSLTNGEYYANKKVTKTTPYSYRMDEAEKLWEVIRSYIER